MLNYQRVNTVKSYYEDPTHHHWGFDSSSRAQPGPPADFRGPGIDFSQNLWAIELVSPVEKNGIKHHF